MCRNTKYFHPIFIYKYMSLYLCLLYLRAFSSQLILVLFGFVWSRVAGLDSVSSVDGILGVVSREFVR